MTVTDVQDQLQAFVMVATQFPFSLQNINLLGAL
jgi:hypothetical protein